MDAHIPHEVFGRTEIREESGAIPEGKRCGLRECCWIDPVSDRLALWNRANALDEIWTLIETKTTGIVGRRVDRKRQSGFRGQNPAQLPSPENRVHRLVPILTDHFLCSERQFVVVIDNQAMGSVAYINRVLGREIVRVADGTPAAWERPTGVALHVVHEPR